MGAIHLNKLIEDISKRKGIVIGGATASEIRDIERNMKRGNLDVDNSMVRLRKLDKLRLGLEGSDWREVESKIKRMLN